MIRIVSRDVRLRRCPDEFSVLPPQCVTLMTGGNVSAVTELAGLKPSRKEIVFDVVGSLGYDLSDWIATATNPRKIRANPKYCYDWSFVQPGLVAIFNLWHGAMLIEGEEIVYRDNFRANAEFHRRNGGNTKWITRGQKLDRDAAKAAKEGLPIRVIVVDGKRRATDNPDSASSRVDGRQLDTIQWHIRKYDAGTGEFLLVRGLGEPEYVDQFKVAERELSAPERRDHNVSAFVRDPAIRRTALRRAAGKCEFCGSPGFRMGSGAIYLETHHVIPLGEGGSDHTRNVVALCPNDHRRSHFAEERMTMRITLLALLNG